MSLAHVRTGHVRTGVGVGEGVGACQAQCVCQKMVCFLPVLNVLQCKQSILKRKYRLRVYIRCHAIQGWLRVFKWN